MGKIFCHHCNEDVNFIITPKEIAYPVKGTHINIEGSIAVCTNCKVELFHRKYDEENQDKAFNIYREKNGILGPDEIKEIRTKYGLNQKDYSKLLGFGEITITRYERGSLPTASQNQHIKNSSDPRLMFDYLKTNKDKISELEAKRLEDLLLDIITTKKYNEEDIFKESKLVLENEPNIFSGNVKFNYRKFEEMVLYFNIKESPYLTKLNKLMFYADYYFYKLYGRSISGTRYLRYDYGPVPEKYAALYGNINCIEILESRFGQYTNLCSTSKFTALNEKEIEMLEFVSEKFKSFYASEISDFSHEEDAWIYTKSKELIMYSFAGKLDPNRIKTL